MFGWKRREARKIPRGGKAKPDLGWDLHAHLLPGVDDGVKTLEDALNAVRALKALGYRGSILTPHIYKGLYPNSRATLDPVLVELRAAISAEGLDYSIEMAAEYFGDEHLLELIERDEILSFGPGNARYVLVEFPYSTEPLLWADALSGLSRRGYAPVLAHIERYRFVIDAPKVWLERFEQFGVKIQCNIGSLVGQYGESSMKFARRMRDEQRATFWGTDLHRTRQVDSYIVPGLTHLIELGALNALLDR